MKAPRPTKDIRKLERAWAAAVLASMATRPIATQSLYITAAYLNEKTREASHRRRAKDLFDAWNERLAAANAYQAPPSEPTH
jgi:hypothetical protein